MTKKYLIEIPDNQSIAWLETDIAILNITEIPKQVGKKKHYCCTYIIGGTMEKPPTKVFICGVCKRELARYPMQGGAKTMELIVEECCGSYWQKW